MIWHNNLLNYFHYKSKKYISENNRLTVFIKMLTSTFVAPAIIY